MSSPSTARKPQVSRFEKEPLTMFFQWNDTRLTDDVRRVWIRNVFCLTVLGVASIAAERCQAEAAGQQFSVAYRLSEPKTLHFNDPKTLAAHVEQCQKLGCEVTHGEHAGHGDVTYKSPRWKALTVPSDELVHQWEGWLQAAGFET